MVFDPISMWMAGSGPGHDDHWVNLQTKDRQKTLLPIKPDCSAACAGMTSKVMVLFVAQSLAFLPRGFSLALSLPSKSPMPLSMA